MPAPQKAPEKFSLESIVSSAIKPPRIVLVGGDKVGKTTIATEATDCILVPVEEGTRAIKGVKMFPKPETYNDILLILQAMTGDHEFKTLIFDSIDWIEPLIYGEVIDRRGEDEKGNAVSSIEDYGYGKGYVYAAEVWREFLAWLDYLSEERGINITFIAHSAPRKIESLKSDPYEREELKLNKQVAALVYEWADLVLHIDRKAKVITREEKGGFGKKEKIKMDVSDDGIYGFTTTTPAYKAGSRYSLPAEIFLPKGKSWEAIQNAIKDCT